MIPAAFPEANAHFGPPLGLAESQVRTITAWSGGITGGSMDGEKLTVVAWLPTLLELQHMSEGRPMFIGFVGGLPPHFPSTSFEEVTHPA